MNGNVSELARVENQAKGDKRLAQALAQLASILVPGEAVETYAVQRRLFALIHRRELVVATSGRLISIRRGLFGSFHPTSVRWQDLKEARIDLGVFGANLTAFFFGGPDLAITGREASRALSGLRKDQAQAVYRICQAQDQAWREKRRVRELEELRARSGGIQLGTSVAGAGLTSIPHGGHDDAVARLEKAKTLLDKGLISDSEFETLKARIVNAVWGGTVLGEALIFVLIRVEICGQLDRHRNSGVDEGARYLMNHILSSANLNKLRVAKRANLFCRTFTLLALVGAAMILQVGCSVGNGTPQPTLAFTYNTNPATYVQGTEITANIPVVSGGTPTSYAVSPSLPAGLRLDSNSGVISGTPSFAAAQTTYVVTAYSSDGNANASLTITVNSGVAPSTLGYSANPAIYTAGTAITPNTPTTTGGAPTSYTITPALPQGLTLNTVTGVITGTPGPSASASSTSFAVSANNAFGAVSTTLPISVITYCTGDSGPVVGQVTSITLEPKNYGISLNYSQISQVPAPTATDCKGSAVSLSNYTYGTFDANGHATINIADVVPSGTNAGKLCGGTWNRNTGGGIPDFTVCNPTNNSGTVYVVASGDGASSNPLPIYVHPVVASVVLGPLSTDCINDPATNCSPAAFATQQVSCTIDPGTGCCTQPVTNIAASTSQNSCQSQGTKGQLAARVYQNGSTTLANNISCKVGHVSYTAQTSSIVTIDQNGVATAQQPGSTVITANISNAGGSAGFFSTCPPASITVSVPNIAGPGTSIVVSPNNTQPINATVMDKNGAILTGLALEFESTTPTTIPAVSAGTVTPTFPGAAAITAVCQPPSCNPSPFNQIGLFGNGKPVTSNPVTIIAPGSNSTNLYIASTNSLYLVPVDFTQPQIGAPIRLPYQPNSMVISNDGSSIYMGSSYELMTYSPISNSVTAQDPSVNGFVLAVSPDGSTVVLTDPFRQFVYLYNPGSGGGVTTQYGGVGTHAAFSPDSQTVYITLGDFNSSTGVTTPNNGLLVHSQFTGWYQTTSPQPATDIAIAVPTVGAFFGG